MKKIFIIIVSLFLVSCVGNENIDPLVKPGFTKWLKVDPANNNEIDLSTIFDLDYKFIILESNDNNLIGNIDKLIIKDEKIFILDRDHTHSVFIFDATGKFISKISHCGNGPGYYHEIGDFYVDTTTKKVNILQSYPATIFTFDYQSNFVKQVRKNSYSWKVAKNSLGNYCFFMMNTILSDEVYHDIVIQNNKGKVLNKYFPINPNDPSKVTIMPNNFIEFGDSLSFIRSFSDTVYDITTNELFVKFIIDFGKHSLPVGFFNDFSIRDFSKANKLMQKNNYARDIYPYCESIRFLYFGYVFNNKYCSAFYSKHTNRLIYSSRLLNNINGLPFRWENVLLAKNNSLVLQHSAHSLINKMKKVREALSEEQLETFDTINKGLLDAISKLSKSDNPILIMYNIKDSF